MTFDVNPGGLSAAAGAVRQRAETIGAAPEAVASACERGAAVAGHEHVAAGLAEFAGYWTSVLGLLGETTHLLSGSLGAAADTYDTVEQDVSGWLGR